MANRGNGGFMEEMKVQQQKGNGQRMTVDKKQIMKLSISKKRRFIPEVGGKIQIPVGDKGIITYRVKYVDIKNLKFVLELVEATIN